MNHITNRNNIDARMQSLYDLHGTLRPRDVIEDARPEDSPMHSYFEWDDGIAGNKYRIQQARELIRSFRAVATPIVDEEYAIFTPKYIKDTTLGVNVPGYMPISSVKDRKVEAKETILVELNRIISSINRAQGISRYFKLEGYFEKLLINTREIQKVLMDLTEAESKKKPGKKK